MKFNSALFLVLFSFMLVMGSYFPIPLTSNTVPGLVVEVLPAVVEIRPGFGNWLGAGVLISDDGWVLTARHVVENQDVVVITMFDESKHMSINIIADSNSDIAILKIDIEDASHVRLSGGYPQLGEPVFVIGHPLGMFYSISSGIVSNVHIDKAPYGSDLIVTDAEVTWGNSGGPLLDMDGHLLGIVVAGSLYFTGLEANLVVPIARGRELLDEYSGQQKIPADCNSVGVSTL